MIYTLLMTALTVPSSPQAGGETAPDAPTFFEEIIGAWHGEGQLFGQPADFEMIWEWELDQRFVRLTYTIRGATDMQAIAHYRLRYAEPLDGIWLDTRGEFLELSATVTDRVLETIWRSPTEEGRTTYQRMGTDSLEVRDYVRDGDEWKLFGHARYTRGVADSVREGWADPQLTSTSKLTAPHTITTPPSIHRSSEEVVCLPGPPWNQDRMRTA